MRCYTTSGCAVAQHGSPSGCDNCLPSARLHCPACIACPSGYGTVGIGSTSDAECLGELPAVAGAPHDCARCPRTPLLAGNQQLQSYDLTHRITCWPHPL
jgi:hypothetical protein